MIDAEVRRLRNLRNVALRTRALAGVLGADPSLHDSVLPKSSLMCWAIARIATGHLRAHPYLSYQKGPSALRDLADRSGASLAGWMARHQGRTLRVYADQLKILARALDDTRALTWSPALSDALGRSQIQLRRFAKEIDSRIRSANGEAALPGVVGRTLDDVAIASNWPYLAI
jgi:hypothetical protein